MSVIKVVGSERPWQLASLRRSVGQRRVLIAALLLAALVAAATTSYFVVAGHFTPASAVNDYLSAITTKNAAAAWNRIEVSAPAHSALANYVDAPALAAALSSSVPAPGITGYRIDSSDFIDSAQTRALVQVTYDTKGGTKQTRFSVVRTSGTHYGVFAEWRVEITPVLLSVDPGYATEVSLDSRPIALRAGTTSVIAVLPLVHVVAFAGGSLLEPSRDIVDGFAASSASVAYQPELTEAGISAAGAAVARALRSCARQPGPNPDSCPQSVNDAFASGGTWALIGDPINDLNVTTSAEGQISASGHAQMVYAYAASDGVRHEIWAGGYIGSVAISADQMTVATISAATGVPGLQRPAAATDQAALAAVGDGFKRCATSTNQNQADCPQALGAPIPENIHWKLNGDPTSGATVAFDLQTGIFTVHGQFDMIARYTVSGYPDTSPSFYTVFDAALLWDGTEFVLVTIQGSFS